MTRITLATTPHPDNWLAYTPRPDMRGKRLGILAHTWFKPEHADQLEPIFRIITDIAVEEPTGLALDANVSLQDPLHNMMYEEWEDYDEFFTTQLNRPYRMAFLRWLVPVMSAPIAAEFYEVIGRSGSFTEGAHTIVLSVKLSEGSAATATPLLTSYVVQIAEDARCLGASAMHSLNDPNHLVVVERWRDLPANDGAITDHPTRDVMVNALSNLSTEGHVTAETYRVHYNPGRFPMPG